VLLLGISTPALAAPKEQKNRKDKNAKNFTKYSLKPNEPVELLVFD
jgi:hypothetical protein